MGTVLFLCVKITYQESVCPFFLLSPYVLEEAVSRESLTNVKADVIIDLIDGRNIQLPLYLTAQLLYLGYPYMMHYFSEYNCSCE